MVVKPLVKLIAPHSCLGCGVLGHIVCQECGPGIGKPVVSVCVFCNRLTTDFKLCLQCRPKIKVSHVTVAARYEGQVETLIQLLKYKGVVEAARPLGRLLADELLRRPDFVVPVPSTARRYRQRGYNPAKLLAREVSRIHKISLLEALGRRGNARQVGAKRAERLIQLEGSFFVRNPRRLAGANILLIDDVVTTGATLRESALTLRSAGARNIRALIVAKN